MQPLPTVTMVNHAERSVSLVVRAPKNGQVKDHIYLGSIGFGTETHGHDGWGRLHHLARAFGVQKLLKRLNISR